jgi:pimeloyl-ACP methyl ester carboxylesterase
MRLRTQHLLLLLLLASVRAQDLPRKASADTSLHTSAFATVNGIKLHYLDWGGTGETLLFITGVGDNAHVFDTLAPRFTDRFRVFVLTRRGFGESDKPATGYDVATLAEDVRGFLDFMKIKKVHLIGHSAAGNEMTSFAAKYPGRTLKLVYLDAAYARQEVAAIENKDPLDPPAPAKKPSEMSAREKIDEEYGLHLLAYDPPYRKVRAPVLSFYAIFEKHWSLKPDTPPEKQKAADDFISTLVRPYQRRNIERIRRELPAAQVVELTGTHHYFFQDASKKLEVVRTIRDFLLN